MRASTFLSAAFFALGSAYTQPTTATWGPLLLPDLTHPVTQGKVFDIQWDPQSHPTAGVTVSLVLCRGPSTNCVTDKKAIVEGIPAGRKHYKWRVPAGLKPGKKNTKTGVLYNRTMEVRMSAME
ncbi:hypothetical protein LTR37_003470 [Vermiconidia calcicola]|uniref:Uncharacterized protein n=1 Tax=Vermiconidia calcicola TaxID=1690605 RepID=A0ACC3NQX1_9PEZI|nr:hypothetical protein LTR37_003470 [Vermiconidia calcicola]